jgi:hypothetical protein
MVDIKPQLKKHLDSAEDWEKMETPIPGVFVVKVPATKTRPALLFLEINPLNDEGKPIKRKGLFIGTDDQLSRFFQAITDDRLEDLIKAIESINPEVKTTKMKKLQM